MKGYISSYYSLPSFDLEQTGKQLDTLNSSTFNYRLRKGELAKVQQVHGLHLMTSDLVVTPNFVMEGRATRIGIATIAKLLSGLNQKNPINLYGGTTHGEADVLCSAVLEDCLNYPSNFLDPITSSLYLDPIPESIEYVFKDKIKIKEWIYSACVTALHVVIFALQDLNSMPNQEQAVAFSVDALNDLEVVGFSQIGATSPTTCRPFHKKRDGMLIGEGACAMLLQKYSDEKSSAMISGYGLGCDTTYLTKSDEDGGALRKSISTALSMSGLQNHEVQLIIAHGTGTVANDAIEAKVFSERFPDALVSSLKGRIGHAMSAAGLFNLLYACRCLDAGGVWSIGSSDKIPVKRDDFIARVPSYFHEIDDLRTILITAMGFGGNAASLIVQKL